MTHREDVMFVKLQFAYQSHSIVRDLSFFLYPENAVICSMHLSSHRWAFVNTHEWQRQYTCRKISRVVLGKKSREQAVGKQGTESVGGERAS